ncbi:MAG: helix-turn-helix transcriptional regulator [Firmicutes bacterium]|nr:helix-turn-helix transcriptional regulator [Bacillota bacterium]
MSDVNEDEELTFDKGRRTPGEMIRARRKQLCWTQEELAWRSEVSVSSIERVENDKVRTSFEIIEKLEKVLNISLRDEFVDFRNRGSVKARTNLFLVKSLAEFECEIRHLGLTDDELTNVLNNALLEAKSIKGIKTNSISDK